jgi:hypothetical protein
MYKSHKSIELGIHNSFIVCAKSFDNDADKLLKDDPDSLGDRKLNYSISGLMKQSTNSLIGMKAFNCTQYIVLERHDRYTGNLGCKVSGLGFTQAKQAFGFL